MKEIIKHLLLSAAAVAIVAGLSLPAIAHYGVPAPVDKPAVRAPGRSLIMRGDTSEKSVKADGSVRLTLCVTQGTLKVNGWNRKEVRVYIRDGNKFNFNVREKNETTGDPNWITIMGVGNKGRYLGGSDCIWGNDIEIDVPLNAIISIKGQETTAQIDSVKRVEISTVGGDISLRNIAAGISAVTRQGDVTVESSKGPIRLDTTTGNIVVFEATPGEIGDPFLAKTHGGTISLQSVQHRQVEVGSISGSVLYNGTILNGGSYNFNSNRGSMRMLIPADSSFQLQATFGAGNFNSELNIKMETENIQAGPIKTIVGRLGTGGDAFVKVSTNNGSISIRKQ